MILIILQSLITVVVNLIRNSHRLFSGQFYTQRQQYNRLVKINNKFMSNQMAFGNIESDHNNVENTLQISDSNLLSENVYAHKNGKLDTTKYQPESQISKKRHNAPISPYYAKIQTNIGQESPGTRGQPQQVQLLLKIGRLLKQNIKINEKVSMYEALYPKICKQNQFLESKLERYERCGRQIEQKLNKKNKAIDYLNDKVKLLCDSKREIEQQLQITKLQTHSLNKNLLSLQNQAKQLKETLNRAYQRSQTLETQLKAIQNQTQLEKSEFQITIKQLEMKHHKEMVAAQKEINKSKAHIQQLNSSYQAKLQQLRLQFEQKQANIIKQLEQQPTHSLNRFQKDFSAKNANSYNEQSTHNQKLNTSHNLHLKNHQQHNSKLIKKIQRKNQELITINKLLEEELEIANMKILELQRYQQDKICEEYIGRLSRFKNNNQFCHKPNKSGYPLSTLENIPEIGLSYPQFSTCLPEKVQPRARIYSHYPKIAKP